MPDQWIRKVKLSVRNNTEALDLSALRIRFKITASDIQTPNTAVIRVYNLREDTTVNYIKTGAKNGSGEYTKVTLEAGYEQGNFGLIFSGNIKQLRHGKENNVTSYLDILAGDGDTAYNFSVINTSVAALATSKQKFDELCKAFAEAGVNPAGDAAALIANANATQGALTRGKVMMGMARDYMSDWAQKNGFRWSIQTGQLTLVPITGYREGTAVQINSQTGMIGTPEVTNAGIMVRCLLNPLIRIGALVQINNRDINQTWVKELFGYPNNASTASALKTSNDGFYRVMVAEFVGDSRGQEWYSELTCLNKDSLMQQTQ